MKRKLLAPLLVGLCACIHAPVLASAAGDPLQQAIASPARAPADRARDAARHPEQTLRFFEIRPDMHVLELWPGTGWYTDILAPLLARDGKLTVTNFDPNGPEDKPTTKLARDLAAKFAADRARFGAVAVIPVAPPEKLDLGADASYDLILTFRNNHGWINGGYHDAMYREAFRVLKPGGTLGVVQHRAKEGVDPIASAKTGYVPESTVIEAAQKAGFTLAARSDINANPKDTTDHPEGVWTLPPVYRLGERDRAKYEAIGESDRMTLRFVKPAAKGPAARP